MEFSFARETEWLVGLLLFVVGHFGRVVLSRGRNHRHQLFALSGLFGVHGCLSPSIVEINVIPFVVQCSNIELLQLSWNRLGVGMSSLSIRVDGLVLLGPHKFVFLSSFACINGKTITAQNRLSGAQPFISFSRAVSGTVRFGHSVVFVGQGFKLLLVERADINRLTPSNNKNMAVNPEVIGRLLRSSLLTVTEHFQKSQSLS
jgi:hypothetical protein